MNKDESYWLEAPGFVGRIAKWILATSTSAQPELAVGAALVAVAALKAHRVRTESDLRTNLYLVNVAPSGAGKDRPLAAVRELLAECGFAPHLIGPPASSVGMLAALSEARGRGIICWDEVGLAWGGASRHSANNWEREILDRLVELFSAANSRFLGREKSREAHDFTRIDIDQPCLCILGASTPQALYGGLTSYRSVDGFAARLLINPGRRDTEPAELPTIADSAPPEHLIAEARRLLAMSTNWRAAGNLGVLKVCARPIERTYDARKLHDEYRDKCAVDADIADDDGREASAAIYRRGGEHCMKVALVLQEGDSIDVRDIAWAIKFVDRSMAALIQAVDKHVADNDRERVTKRIEQVIEEAGAAGVSARELYRATRGLSKGVRAEILGELEDHGYIFQEVWRLPESQKATTFWKHMSVKHTVKK